MFGWFWHMPKKFRNDLNTPNIFDLVSECSLPIVQKWQKAFYSYVEFDENEICEIQLIKIIIFLLKTKQQN